MLSPCYRKRVFSKRRSIATFFSVCLLLLFLLQVSLPVSRTTLPPLLFIVVSTQRPQGVDYASELLRSIYDGFALYDPPIGSRLRVILFDADLPEHRREDSWFAALPTGLEVFRATADALAELATVNDDPRFDKHHDPVQRIRRRTKGAKDLSSVMSLAYEQSVFGWPYAIVLQDDVQLSSRFFARLYQILSAPVSEQWLAWVLFHAEAFDHGRRYADGAAYDYEACDQALLYRTAEMGSLVEYIDSNWRHDPSDWQLRDYQRKSGALLRVAQPSMVQHIGTVSSLSLKAGKGGGIASGCFAPDFEE